MLPLTGPVEFWRHRVAFLPLSARCLVASADCQYVFHAVHWTDDVRGDPTAAGGAIIPMFPSLRLGSDRGVPPASFWPLSTTLVLVLG